MIFSPGLGWWLASRRECGRDLAALPGGDLNKVCEPFVRLGCFHDMAVEPEADVLAQLGVCSLPHASDFRDRTKRRLVRIPARVAHAVDPEQTEDEVEFRGFLGAREKRIEGVEEPAEPLDEGRVIPVFRNDYPHAVRVAFRACHRSPKISDAVQVARAAYNTPIRLRA